MTRRLVALAAALLAVVLAPPQQRNQHRPTSSRCSMSTRRSCAATARVDEFVAWGANLADQPPRRHFDTLAHTLDPRVQGDQLKNRLLLKDGLEAQGFVNYENEWWHFTFNPEPFGDTYFDFVVDRSSV